MTEKMNSFIFADLIKKNIKYHQKELDKLNKPHDYVSAIKICSVEIRENKVLGAEKARAGLVWYEIKRMGLNTREIFFLITCWFATIVKNGEIEHFTESFQDLMQELYDISNEGVSGKHKDISSKECSEEWDNMAKMVGTLHSFYKRLNSEIPRSDK